MAKRNKSEAPKNEMGYQHFLRSGAGAHNTRAKDVRRGSSRKTKHKGRIAY